MNNKFIDKDGLKVLWNQISLQDYPNNETLIAVINAIDQTKANQSELDKFKTETWTFTLNDGTVITKQMVVK